VQTCALPISFAKQSIRHSGARTLIFGCDEQRLAVDRDHRVRDRLGGHSPAAKAGYRDRRANWQRLPRPAAALESDGARHFKIPRGQLPVFVDYVDVKMGMWIRPLDLRNDAL